MVNDWASKARPDLLHFIPYTWKLSLLLKEFELITLCNEYNWIDCSSQNQENCKGICKTLHSLLVYYCIDRSVINFCFVFVVAHIAFCGDLFDLSFDLPFVDFLPPTVPLRFWIQVCKLEYPSLRYFDLKLDFCISTLSCEFIINKLITGGKCRPYFVPA